MKKFKEKLAKIISRIAGKTSQNQKTREIEAGKSREMAPNTKHLNDELAPDSGLKPQDQHKAAEIPVTAMSARSSAD